MKKVIIAIPIYNEKMSGFEESSFVQCCKILNKYSFSLICPNSLTLERYKVILKKHNVNYTIEKFDDSFFESVKSYNRLMMSKNFYDRFKSYEFMLIYQLDAYVFRDKLEYWCEKDFDYIGAPWFKNFSSSDEKSELMEVGGNGGFSLRKISSFIEVLDCDEDNRDIIDNFIAKGSNEDGFFAFEAKKIKENFKVAPVNNAINFSFECQPKRLYEMRNKKLPFGCHAWERYDFDFWEEFINLEKVNFQKENKFNLKKISSYKILIEKQEGRVKLKDNQLNEFKCKLTQKNKELQQKDQKIAQKNQELQQKDQKIAQKNQELQQKDQKIAQKNQELQQKYAIITQKGKEINAIITQKGKEINAIITQKEKEKYAIITQKEKEKDAMITQKEKEKDAIINSKSFRIGTLVFRSTKKPYKLLTFPINFLRILLGK